MTLKTSKKDIDKAVRHVQELISEYDYNQASNSELNSCGDDKFARSILEKYGFENDRIVLLNHWLDNVYISRDGKRFLCGIICLASRKDSPAPILMNIELYLRQILIGAFKPTVSRGTPCPTPTTQLDLSVDSITQAVDPQKGLPHFNLILGYRDNFVCQASKITSWTCLTKLRKSGQNEELCNQISLKAKATGKIQTEAAHILPFTLADISGACNDPKLLCWQGLYRVFPEIRRSVNANTINDFFNAFTLDSALYGLFQSFLFGLNPMGNHRYEVIAFEDNLVHLDSLPKTNDGRTIVEFTYAENTGECDKVCDDLLRIHLAIAVVFHQIGAPEFDDDEFIAEDKSPSGTEGAGGHSPRAGDDHTTDGIFAQCLAHRLVRLVVGVQPEG